MFSTADSHNLLIYKNQAIILTGGIIRKGNRIFSNVKSSI